MLPAPILALALAIVSADLAHAQVTPPNVVVPDGTLFSLAPGYYSSRTPEQVGREVEIERKYRETVNARIPDKKGSNDPWRNVRPAATASAPDRHRPQ